LNKSKENGGLSHQKIDLDLQKEADRNQLEVLDRLEVKIKEEDQEVTPIKLETNKAD